MKRTTVPYDCDLKAFGYVRGTTVKHEVTEKGLCHYFGGVPYALPPIGPYRWRKPRPLPPGFRYGTKANPRECSGSTKICPQFAPHTQPDPDQIDENCLQANIWLPVGEPPERGWPVYFYIHGGSLQFGSPNELDYSDMLSETRVKAVIVCPAYRLNIFGFLASTELLEEASVNGEPLGNFGFWDQRLALEWTQENIHLFGGDPSNTTMAGYSAGAHSVFYQLSYDLGLPVSKSIIKQAIMHSNSTGVQPKFVEESQHQFHELLTRLHIPLTLSTGEKLERLRAASAEDLVAANKRMSIHEFRSVSDGIFVRKSLFRELEDGSYARIMKERGIRLWIGECSEEHYLYRTLRPPKGDSFEAIRTRLLGEYPQNTVDFLINLYFPGARLPPQWNNWNPDAFGHLWADIQVYMLQRGFIWCLVRGGAGALVHRYRVEWRAKETDAKIPREWGVTHSTDNSIWVHGEGRGLDSSEKAAAKIAFLDLYAQFISGQDISADFGAVGPYEVRRMRSDGTVDIWKDTMWEKGVEMWNALNKDS